MDELFDGEGDIFIDCFADGVTTYGEYGCGLSTLWVLENTTALVRSVDTSSEWAHLVTRRSGMHRDRLDVTWVDVGPLGDWGRPLSYAHADRFSDYTLGIFLPSSPPPDVILVDGRFRVACFLTAVRSAAPGTRIVFDDYHREHYHIVEDVLAPVERNDRQALFVVPETIDDLKVSSLRDKFLYVME